MKTKFRQLEAVGYAMAVMLLVLGIDAIPAFMGHASAAQVTARSVKMSVATVAATSVKYSVQFTSPTSATIKGIVVDFCDNDPLIGDSCTKPTGFTVSGSPTFTNNPDSVSNLATVAGWTAASANSGRTFELTDTTGTTTNGTTVKTFNFSINTVTNPDGTDATCSSNPNCEFWARIVTYTNASGADSPATYAAGTEGNYTDYGGVAISTTQPITITARVMETLTFCVTSWSSLSTGNCANANVTSNLPNLTIGHGTTTLAIDPSATDAKSAYTQLSTNATSGAIVRMKNTSSTTCGGLSRDSGSTCTQIPAVSSGAITPSLMPPGTAAFGMCVVPGTSVTADAPYDGSSPGTVACADTTTPNANTSYGMDDQTSGNNVVATYGSTIYHTAGPVNKSTSVCNFAATAASTTPAGVYSATDSLIATGTF